MTKIYIKVEPDADEFKVEKNSFWTFHIPEKAEHGRANAFLKRNLENILGEKVGIVSGRNSSRKEIKVGVSEEEFEEKLGLY